MRPDLLFRRKGDLNEVLSEKKKILEKEIENLDKDYVMKVSEDDLARYMVSKYALEAPVIHEDKMYVFDPADTQIEVSRGHVLSDFALTRSFYVKGTKITVAVPFEGDEDLFHFKPSTFTLDPPRGEVVNQELHLVYETVDQDPEELKRACRRDSAEIKKYLEWVRNQVNSFNKQLESLVRENIAARKKKLMDDMGLVASLGIPIKRREGSPTTYTIPSIRKKPAISVPIVSNEPFELEPVLSEDEYENIRAIFHDMALVMERSPRTFSKLSEEEIRDLFLMVLNSQYG